MVADKATMSALSGDPRRPDNVVPYQQREPSEDKVDPYSTIGMVLAGLGVFTKVRLFCFISLAFVASSFIQRNSDTDPKQNMMCLMMSVMGIFLSHLNSQAGSHTNSTEPATGTAAGFGAGMAGTGQA